MGQFDKKKFCNEFLGCFIFVTGCLHAGGDPFKIGASLFLAAQCFDGSFNPASQLSGILDGDDPVDALFAFGAQVGGAVFAYHFSNMDFGANSGHVSQFVGTFFFFSGCNAAGASNFDKALALACAAFCFGGDLNPAITTMNALNGGGFNAALATTVIAQVMGAYASKFVKDFANSA